MFRIVFPPPRHAVPLPVTHSHSATLAAVFARRDVHCGLLCGLTADQAFAASCYVIEQHHHEKGFLWDPAHDYRGTGAVCHCAACDASSNLIQYLCEMDAKCLCFACEDATNVGGIHQGDPASAAAATILHASIRDGDQRKFKCMHCQDVPLCGFCGHPLFHGLCLNYPQRDEENFAQKRAALLDSVTTKVV